MNIVYNIFKSLGVKVFFLVSLLLFVISKAQIIVNITLPWTANDILSKELYKDMVSAHRKLNEYALAKTGVVAKTKEVYIEPNKELTRISPGLTSKKGDILKFVSEISYNYIKYKYPIVATSPLASGKFSNLLVRERFSKKFNAENENIANYFDNTNYIPEGERLRFIQQALDKVIRLTLEDETY